MPERQSDCIDGILLPCDLILLTGSVLVNEAMLTGESIPVMKRCLPEDSEDPFYREIGSEKHTLYGGTKVIQVRTHGSGTEG